MENMKNLKNKNVLVYGLSVSGVWCAKLLQKKKAHIFLFDDNQEKLKGVGIKNCEILLSLGPLFPAATTTNMPLDHTSSNKSINFFIFISETRSSNPMDIFKILILNSS